MIIPLLYRIFLPNTKVDTCEAQCGEARINSEELELSLAGFRKKKSGKFLLEQFPLTPTSYLKEVGQMVSFSGGSATRGVTFAVVTRLKEKRQSYRNEA